MYKALIREPNEVCNGKWFEKYPTLENRARGEFFQFELLPGQTEESTHLVDNLKASDERMSIKTSWRFPFAAETYVAAFGNLYKIERVGTERKIRRGIAFHRVTYTLYLVRCSNPLGL